MGGCEAQTADTARALHQPAKMQPDLAMLDWQGAAGGRKSRWVFTERDLCELEETELEPGLAELTDGVGWP